MNVGDRVSLTDAQKTHEGTVTTVRPEGMLVVKWDSGSVENVHASELKRLPERVVAEAPPSDEPLDDEGYEESDPKHPTFRERIAAWWDAR